MHPRSRLLLECAVVAVLVAACGTTATPAPTPTLIPDADATVVVGTETCTAATDGDTSAGDVGQIVEHFRCEDEMSDPRVSGTLDLRLVTTIGASAPGAIWRSTEATLTNDGGSWRGAYQGVVDFRGVLPFAEGLAPFNYGNGQLFGEGAYAGLEYHVYITGSNEKVGVAGWIVPTP